MIIRLGEQAGDTGLMAPLIAMWAANVVLGAAARDPARASTTARPPSIPSTRATTRRLLPAHPHAQGRAGAGGARARTAPRPAPAPRRRPPHPPHQPAHSRPHRPLHRAHLRRKFALVLAAFWAIFVLVSFMDLFDDVQQNKVKGIVVAPLLHVLHALHRSTC